MECKYYINEHMKKRKKIKQKIIKIHAIAK